MCVEHPKLFLLKNFFLFFTSICIIFSLFLKFQYRKKQPKKKYFKMIFLKHKKILNDTETKNSSYLGKFSWFSKKNSQRHFARYEAWKYGGKFPLLMRFWLCASNEAKNELNINFGFLLNTNSRNVCVFFP